MAGWVWVVVWAVALAVPMTLLAAGHLLALPIPAADVVERKTAAFDLRVTHVLSGDCGCSIQIARWLAERDDVGGDAVLWVGPHDEAADALVAAGYAMTRIDGDDLFAEHGITGTPCLLIHDADNALRYRGGYAPRRPVSPSDLADRSLLARIAAGERVEQHPAFGCASYGPTREQLDPFELKRR